VKAFTATPVLLWLLVCTVAQADETPERTIGVTRNGSQASRKGPEQFFTGSVRIDPLFQRNDPSHTSAAYVTFEPGARSAWHTHPLGQTLIVTAGTGWVQRWGDQAQEIRPGDVVWIPPGQKHWHGASPTTGMTHLAIQGAVNETNVEWMEKVSDEQYVAAAKEKTMVTPEYGAPPTTLTPDDVRSVAPAIEKYAQGPVAELWKRPGLSRRDRGLVTVAALIARGLTAEMPRHFDLALDDGVKPGEMSELITHLAFYSGWANAMSAVAIAKDVFGKRGIGSDQLPPASPLLLALDEAAEAQRAVRVQEQFGAVAPGIVQYTTDVLFHDLWLRPGLAPRDRSLVTISALIASGQVAQIPYHLNRAMDNGLTQAQAAEVITHLAFYAGWPNAFSALPVAKEVFEKRTR
jgi:4-carboxymuconolactone decarboxylase